MHIKNIKEHICNPTVRFSKYVVILIFLVGVVGIGYNQVCSQILPFYDLNNISS